MRYIKVCVFLILVNTGKIAYSMPAPWSNEEYVRDRQGNTKEQGQGSHSDNRSTSSTNGTRSRP